MEGQMAQVKERTVTQKLSIALSGISAVFSVLKTVSQDPTLLRALEEGEARTDEAQEALIELLSLLSRIR
jgi:hypothetical protein